MAACKLSQVWLWRCLLWRQPNANLHQSCNSSTSFKPCFLLLLPPLLLSAITKVAERACRTIEATFGIKKGTGPASPQSMSGWSNAWKFFCSMWLGRMWPQWTWGLAHAKRTRCWSRSGLHRSHRTNGTNHVGSSDWHIATWRVGCGRVGCRKHIGTLTPSTLISNDSQGTSSALWSPHRQRNLWNL